MKLTGVFSLLALLPIAMASPAAVLHDARGGGDNGVSTGGGYSSSSGSSSGYNNGGHNNGGNSGSGSGSGYNNGGNSGYNSGSGSGYGGSGSGNGHNNGGNSGSGSGSSYGGSGSGSGYSSGRGGGSNSGSYESGYGNNDNGNSGSSRNNGESGSRSSGSSSSGSYSGSGSESGSRSGSGENSGSSSWSGSSSGGSSSSPGRSGSNGGENSDYSSVSGLNGNNNGDNYNGNNHHDNNNNSYDVRILNFALTFEQLAVSFYNSSLSRFNEEEFRNRGYPEWVRGRYEQIKEHEKKHVEFLEGAIRSAGAQAVERCEYRFPDSSVEEFVELSVALETVGASAYNGFLRRLESKDYITVFGSILGVEARHAAWINSAVKKQNPWNTAFETPITVNQTWSIIKPFIRSCPNNQENTLLPDNLRAYPTLHIPPRVQPGEKIEISFENTYCNEGRTLYAAFIIGTGTFFQEVRTENGKRFVTIPKELEAKGAVYIVIIEGEASSSGQGRDELRVREDNTVAGPALVMFPFNSKGKPEGENRDETKW